MKNARSLLIMAALNLAGLLAGGLIGGCESDSAARKIEIRPDAVSLRLGESVTLTAYNGYIYQWSLQNESLGRLNTRSGVMVTYTSLSDPTAPQLQIVTVTSTFSDNSSGGGSNPVTQTAQAFITHIPATSLVGMAESLP